MGERCIGLSAVTSKRESLFSKVDLICKRTTDEVFDEGIFSFILPTERILDENVVIVARRHIPVGQFDQ